jgi:hypothetical protein
MPYISSKEEKTPQHEQHSNTKLTAMEAATNERKYFITSRNASDSVMFFLILILI